MLETTTQPGKSSPSTKSRSSTNPWHWRWATPDHAEINSAETFCWATVNQEHIVPTFLFPTAKLYFWKIRSHSPSLYRVRQGTIIMDGRLQLQAHTLHTLTLTVDRGLVLSGLSRYSRLTWCEKWERWLRFLVQIGGSSGVVRKKKATSLLQ